MSITATELKKNLNKYLMLAATEDVYITQYGKVVAKLSNPFQDRVASLCSASFRRQQPMKKPWTKGLLNYESIA